MMKNKGAVSVLLCVIFLSIILVLGAALDVSSLSVANAYAKRINYMACKSVLAEYDKNLFRDYGLMAYNLSMGEVEDKVKEYISQMGRVREDAGDEIVFFDVTLDNIDVKISSDNLRNTTVFSEQIKEFMKYKMVEVGIDKIKDIISGKNEIDEKVQSAKQDLADEKKKIKEAAGKNNDENGSESDSEETESREPLDLKESKFNAEDESEDRVLRSNRIIDSLPSGVDSESIDKKIYDLSEEDELISLGEDSSDYLNKFYSKADSSAEKLLIMEYIKLYLKNGVNSGDFTKETFFTNETEYILKGRMSDKENKAFVKKDIFLLRTALNIAYIYSNQEMRNLALEAAAATGAGPYAPAVQFLIISAWAGAESKQDLDLLYSGKKVPFIKDKNSWSLDIDSIFGEKKYLNSEHIGENGVDYTGYLQILLLMCDKTKMIERTMDIIQINMKGRYNIQFDLRNCITEFSDEAEFKRISYLPSVLPGIVEDNFMSVGGEFSYKEAVDEE